MTRWRIFRERPQYETYEDYDIGVRPPGWVIAGTFADGTPAVSSLRSRSPPNSLRFKRPGTTGGSYARYDYGKQQTKNYYGFSIFWANRTDPTPIHLSNTTSVGYPNGSTVVVYINTDGRVFIPRPGGGALSTTTTVLTLGWHDIFFAIDWNAKTYKIYIDGVLRHENVSFFNPTIGTFRYMHTFQSGANHEMFLDNITSYDTPPLDEELYDMVLTDTFNRFAREARIRFYDPEQALLPILVKGTTMLIQYEEAPGIWRDRFGGFVVDTENDRDTLDVAALSHDLWLRKRTIFEPYQNKTISYILEHLIGKYTPLDYVPSLVNIVNDLTITRTWQAEPLDEVLYELASISGGEEFGATDKRQFFFQPRLTRPAPFPLVEGFYVDTKWSKPARQEVNKATVYYGKDANQRAISVEDPIAQQEYAERVGASVPIVLEVVRAYPEITFDPGDPASIIAAEDSARRKAQRILEGDASVLTGVVLAFGLENFLSGDVVTVQDEGASINTDFRIAKIIYRYLSGETLVTLAENSDNVVDLLVELSEEKTRIDMRNVDPNVTPTKTVNIDSTGIITMWGTILIKQPGPEQFTFGPYFGNLGDPGLTTVEGEGGILGDLRNIVITIPFGGS